MTVLDLLNSIRKRRRSTNYQLDTRCKIRARKVAGLRKGKSKIVFKRSGMQKGRPACGMLDCLTCGIFWQMEIDDLERRVPNLVRSGQDLSTVTMYEERSSALDQLSPTSPSSISTLTEFTEDESNSERPLFANSPALPPSSTLTEMTELGEFSKAPYLDSVDDVSSSLTEFTENHASTVSSRCLDCGSPISSSISTLTDLSDLGVPSSIGSTDEASNSMTGTTCSPVSSPEMSSVLTTPSSLPKQSPSPSRSPRTMIKMSDGSEWLPPTLERIQSYISSQGERPLSRSIRNVITQKTMAGSEVAISYRNAIFKVDLKVLDRDIAETKTKRRV